MLVTNKGNLPIDDYLKFIAICASAGITSVQLREKKLSRAALLDFGGKLKAILKPFKIPLIINDNVEVAYQLDAEGVHLGQSDGSALEARQKLGKDKIIGLSISTKEQLQAANTLPIDYVGIGAIFPTRNKANISTIWGCEGLKKIAPLSVRPVIAIGGINETNILEVIRAGAHGIAAIGAFHDTQEPENTIRNLSNNIEGIKI